MTSAVLGMSAVFASIQLGWTYLDGGSKICGLRLMEPVLDVAVSNSTNKGLTHKEDPEAAETHVSRASYQLDYEIYGAALA